MATPTLLYALETVVVSYFGVSRYTNTTEFIQHDIDNYSFDSSLVDVSGLAISKLILGCLFWCLLDPRVQRHKQSSRLQRSLALAVISILLICQVSTCAVSIAKIALSHELRREHTGLAALITSLTFGIFEIVMCVSAFLHICRWIPDADLRSEEELGYMTLDDEGRPTSTDPYKGKISLQRVAMLAWPERWILAVATVALFLSSAAQMVVPALFGSLISTISHMDFDDPKRGQELDKLILEMVVVFFISCGFAFVRGTLYTLAGERLVARFRVKLFDAIIHQDISFFDTSQSGELQSRLANDTTVIQNAVTTNVSMGLRFFAQAVVCLVILFAVSWELTFVMLSVIPLLAISARVYGSYMRGLSKQYQEALGQAGQTAEQAFGAIRTVRSFANEDFEVSHYRRDIDESFAMGKKRAYAYGYFISGISLFAYLAVALVLWYGGHRRDITPAKLTSFLLYTIYVAVALGGLSGLYSTLMSAVGASERMFGLLDQDPVIDNRCYKFDPTKDEEWENGVIEFQEVSFVYPTRPDVQVLDKISFECRPGEITALVGPSGSGKTTCISLLQRFYNPDSGRVLINNKDVRTVNASWLHRHVAVVSQEPILFSTSIAENILYGMQSRGKQITGQVSREDIENAAKQANAFEFISSFPEGFDTHVGERGITLSGGQKQRIAIARAILAAPHVLLLDEATSSLDSQSEKLVQQALDKIMVSQTSLVIAHRTSTIRSAHRILVLGKGKIMEQGTHEELLANESYYHKMWNAYT